jgi:hypothetical protein
MPRAMSLIACGRRFVPNNKSTAARTMIQWNALKDPMVLSFLKVVFAATPRDSDEHVVITAVCVKSGSLWSVISADDAGTQV